MIRTWNRTAVSQAAFVLLLGCCATLILRPAELIPPLAGLPIYEGFILGALLFGINSLRQHFVWNHLKQQPATLCVVGVLCAVAASHVSHFFLSGALNGSIYYLKSVLFFGLIIALTDTVSRMRWLIGTVAVVATLTVSLCLIDFFEIVDFQFITHASEGGGYSDTNERVRVTRMCGTGIFHDPNDLSLLIVFSGVACAYFLMQRSSAMRFVWLVPLTILAVGLLCTKSRGGLLSAGAAFQCLLIGRYGWRSGIVGAALCFAALPLMALRQTGMGFDEGGTGHERLTLWREGLYALRSPSILFGIGQGMYEDWAGLVAHNSFVHAFVELGLFGGTLFLGCFFFPALSLWRLRRERQRFQHPELSQLYPFVVAMLAGWTIGLQSLSRAYMVSTYLMLGTVVAFVNLASANVLPRRLLVSWDRPHVVRLAACSVLAFVSFNVFVMVFAG